VAKIGDLLFDVLKDKYFRYNDETIVRFFNFNGRDYQAIFLHKGEMSVGNIDISFYISAEEISPSEEDAFKIDFELTNFFLTRTLDPNVLGLTK
jgi:hypothetical protein